MNAFYAAAAIALAAVVVRAVVVPRLAWREPPLSQLRRRQLDREVAEGGAVEWPGEAIDGGWKP